MHTISVLVLTSALFLAMVVNLAVKPRFYSRLNGTLMVLSILGGIWVYGYGYAYVGQNIVLSVFRAAFAVGGMFLGRNDFSVVSGAPLFSSPLMVTVFWLSHLCAFYTTANAAMTTIGNAAMKKLRTALSRRGDLLLVFGDENALRFSRSLCARKDASVVLVTDSTNAASAKELNLSLRTEEGDLHPGTAFLKSLGMKRGSRRLEVYAMHPDRNRSLLFVRELLAALEAAGINPEQTSVTLEGSDEDTAATLQVLGEKYGYGHVFIYNEAELAARLMIRKCPPWETVRFNEDGSPAEDFEVLVIGFGQIGQAVLRQLIVNGQFGHFRAAVLAPSPEEYSGFFRHSFAEVLKHYPIEFLNSDARSDRFYEWLEKHRSTLKYIAVCIGDARTAEEAAEELTRYTTRRNLHIPVICCSHDGVRLRESADQPARSWPLLAADNLPGSGIDTLAMQLNANYMHDESRTPWEHWRDCDSFSRDSSRSSTDFFPALLYAAGLSGENAAENISLSDAQKEALGRLEHERWCAFHYCRGFRPMTAEEWDRRREQYLREVRETGSSRVRLAKDTVRRTHACLIPWEELPALDARESAVTGRPCDYRQADIDNVLLCLELLRKNAAGQEK